MNEIFKEMLTHARHQEQQRHNFLSVIIVIVAAVISLDSKQSLVSQNVILFVLYIISLLGYGLTWVWNNAYFKYKFIAGKILADNYSSCYEYYKKSKKNTGYLARLTNARIIYIIFYSVLSNLLLFQLLKQYLPIWILSICICIGLIMISTYYYYHKQYMSYIDHVTQK